MLVDKARGIWADVQTRIDTGFEPDTVESPRPDPHSSLFQCSECDVVYIALEKDRCSSCRTEVTEVSPTLNRG